MSPDVVTADSLCRSFGATRVLRNVTFSVAQGSVCSLLGPNGAGKTTLLKLLAGLIHLTAGECSVMGDTGWPRSASLIPKVGCLIDGFEPPGGARLRHLLSLNREIGPAFDAKRAETLLAEKGLTTAMRWRSLSKGQRRWALLAMLLCRGCDLLLLDEPADGLDPASRLQLYQLLRREANERGVTILVTTHILNDIERVTDDVCILHEGRIILQESLEDLREQVFFVEVDAPFEIPDDVQVLRARTGNQTEYWLRDITRSLKARMLPGEICRRNVSLEELYLAVTREMPEQVAESKELSTR